MRCYLWFFVAVILCKSQEYLCDESCKLTKWSEWSECRREVQCENEPGTEDHRRSRVIHGQMQRIVSPRSPMSEQIMEDMMRKKQNHMDQLEDCKETVCPQDSLWSDQGKVTCDSNKGFAGNKACLNIDQVAFISTKTLMQGFYMHRNRQHSVGTNDVWGWTDPQTKDEWVIVGMIHGVSFVKITDKSSPQVLAFIESRHKPSTWRDMKVVDDVVYIVSEASKHGLQYFDLHRLRSLKIFKLLYPDGEMKHFGPAHNIVSQEERKFVYVVGATKEGKTCEGGLHIIDVSQRLKPRYVGCYSQDGYTHDAQCVTYQGKDSRYKNKNVCFCFNEDTLTIVNMEDVENPSAISVTTYGGASYVHQGWLTESHNTLLLDDELDEHDTKDTRTKTFLWDVANLEKPQLMNTHYHSITAIDHNQYVKGNYTFQSNYAEGLRILQIDEEMYRLKEVAYFDVDAESAKADFQGTWSNYPFFASGVVPVTSIERGLFLLEPNWDEIRKLSSQKRVALGNAFSTRTRNYDYGDGEGPNAEDCAAAILMDKKACTKGQCLG